MYKLRKTERPSCALARWILPGILLMALSNGCALFPKRPGGVPRDHAFIAYWPPPENSPPQLKLAVKDNIDVQGVVTSAGSEYLSKNRPPAARDAECLAIARRRNVQIVGKTNLSEFAIAASGKGEGTGRRYGNGGVIRNPSRTAASFRRRGHAPQPPVRRTPRRLFGT